MTTYLWAGKLPNGNLERPIGGNYLSPFIGTSSSSASVTLLEETGDDLALDQEKYKFTAFPNPFSDEVTVTFSMEDSGEVTLDIFDVKGTLVRRLYQGHAEANKEMSFQQGAGKMADGIYIVRLVSNQQVSHRKIILKRP
jgi:hypothetical protein